MKTFAVLGTMALGILLAGPPQAGKIPSVLSGSGIHLGVPSPGALGTALGLDPAQALLASNAAAAIQVQPANPPPKDVNLTINVNKEGVARAWYLSPVWMAIGGLGLILGLILVIMAARGGGAATTVVRG